jgi:hypothetical protein
LEELATRDLREEVEALGGYDASHSGQLRFVEAAS